jgi:hypothetical protein
MANERRMTLQEWQQLAASTLARSRSARTKPQARSRTYIPDDGDWTGLSVSEIIERETARIAREDAKRLAREKVLSAMVKDADRGESPLTRHGVVEEMLARAVEEEQRLNPTGRSRYDARHTPPKKRW